MVVDLYIYKKIFPNSARQKLKREKFIGPQMQQNIKRKSFEEKLKFEENPRGNVL